MMLIQLLLVILYTYWTLMHILQKKWTYHYLSITCQLDLIFYTSFDTEAPCIWCWHYEVKQKTTLPIITQLLFKSSTLSRSISYNIYSKNRKYNIGRQLSLQTAPNTSYFRTLILIIVVLWISYFNYSFTIIWLK